MQDFTVCLNVAFKAEDRARAEIIVAALELELLCTRYSVSNVEADDLEGEDD